MAPSEGVFVVFRDIFRKSNTSSGRGPLLVD